MPWPTPPPQIADRGGNIDRIRRIASYPVTAIEFQGSGVSVEDLRRPLAAVAAAHGADIAVQEAGLDRRGQYLVVMDVDSTFIQDEVIDLLADEAGVMAEVAAITERAMAGELDFEQSLRARAALLAGLPESALARVRERITLTPGARTLCRTLGRLGYRIALVSGGFTEVIAPIAADLGVTDVRANTLEVRDGVLTGNVIGPVIDRLGKRAALEAFARQYAIPPRRTIAIGDGANDVDMLAAAGLGHRVQREGGRAGGGRHRRQRALPRLRPLPDRDHPRGDRVRGRARGHRVLRSPDPRRCRPPLRLSRAATW